MIDPYEHFTEERAYWRFKQCLEPLGEFGEKLWAAIMHQSGMSYIPLSHLPAVNGKGPRLQGDDAILPDFEIAGGHSRRAYIDSKVKSHPVLFKIADEVRHGIDRKDYSSYEAISGINRQKCFIGLVELFEVDERSWSGAIMLQTLGLLGVPVAGFSTQSHMVYWPRSSFAMVGKLSAIAMLRVSANVDPVPTAICDVVKSAICGTAPLLQTRFA